VALNTLLFTALYKWLPRAPIRWKPALCGGLFAALAWELGRQLLASIVIGQKYTNAYGVVGAFIAILLWCYYAATIVFLGAEVVQETTSSQAATRPHREPFSRDRRERVSRQPGSTA
jgi:membrane protein